MFGLVRRFLKLIIVLILIVGVGVAWFVSSALNGLVKKGVETAGPMVAKVPFKLEKASVSPLTGNGELTGVVVGNPEGFRSPSALRADKITISIKPSSLLSERLVIQSVHIQAPEITLETGFNGTNLKAILANIDAFARNEKAAIDKVKEHASRKVEVGEIVISGGRLRFSVGPLLGASTSVALPEIRLQDLGKGPEGITGAELAQKVLQAILEKVTLVGR